MLTKWVAAFKFRRHGRHIRQESEVTANLNNISFPRKYMWLHAEYGQNGFIRNSTKLVQRNALPQWYFGQPKVPRGTENKLPPGETPAVMLQLNAMSGRSPITWPL